MISKPLDEEAIFKGACRIESPQARADYLQQACGDDQPLYDRVSTLLQVHDEEPSFLEQPAAALAATAAYKPLQEGPGTVIGPYKLLEQIGEGGFGVVYMAQQTEPIRRKVALKIIKPGMDTQQVIARFEVERQVLALMDHPHIARVLDAGATETGRPFFVMELVRGVPITEFSNNSQLTSHERLELFITVCQAVQHAHQKGIIHRDIKPSNVMVTSLDGTLVPKIIDFGVAKAIYQNLTEPTLYTSFAQMIGTPLYMSPEQAEMNGLDVDTRTDVYSLGVLLYELLTGSTPFDKQTMEEVGYDEMRRIIREDEPPRPSARISTLQGEALSTVSMQRGSDPRKLSQIVRGDLDWIVMTALEKDRTRRYESASALSADVRRYLDHEPIQVKPPTVLDRAAKWSRRHRPVVAVAGLVLAILMVASVISTALIAASYRVEKVQRKLAQANAEEADKQQGIALGEKARAEQREETAQRYLYLAHMNVAQHAWEEKNVERITELLNRQRPTPVQKDLRSFEWYYWWRMSHRYLRSLDGRGYSVNSVAISPDGKTLAAGSGDHTVKLWDVAGGKLKTTLRGHVDSVMSVAFSPDGKTLASGSWDNAFKLWDVATGRLKITLNLQRTIHHDKTCPVAFSPDGKTLATGHRDLTVKLWDVATGQLKTTLDHGTSVVSVTFSPNGKVLASAGNWGGPVKLWDVVTGKLKTTLSQAATVWSVAFSPDGKTLALGCGDKTVKLWNMDTGQLITTLAGHTRAVLDVAFSPDGKTLASGSGDRTVKLWDVATGRLKATLKGHGAGVTSVTFSPSSTILASGSGDGTVKLWDLDSIEPNTILVHREQVRCVAFSPDGNTLASAGQGIATIKMWDVASGELKTTTPPRPDNHNGVMCVAFSPDGRTLASTYWGPPGDVSLWDVATGRLKATLEGHAETARALAFSPDGKTLASGSWDHTIRLWDLDTYESKAILRGHTLEVHSVAFSPDGKILASGSLDGKIKLWDLTTQTTLKENLEWCFAVAFSPDGRTLAAGGSNGIKLFDLATGKQKTPLNTHAGPVRWVAFSPDGQTLASASADRTIKLWDLATGELKTTLKGHTRGIWCVAFSPDGKTLASGSLDRTVRLWRAAGEDEVLDHNTLRQKRLEMLVESPEVWLAWHRREAQSSVAAAQWFAALFHLDPLIEAEPAQWQHWSRRGKAHAGLEQWDKAVGDLTEAIRLNPDDVAAWVQRADVHRAMGQHEQADGDSNRAIELLTEAIRLNSDDVAAWEQRAHVHRAMGQHEKAASDSIRAVELKQELKHKKMTDETEQIIRNINPRTAKEYVQRAKLFQQLKAYDKALADYDKAIEIDPSDANALWHRGWYYRNLGKLQNALTDYNKSIELNDRNPAVYRQRATVWNRLGEHRKAIDDAKHSLEIAPNNYWAHHHLCKAFIALKLYDKALAEFERKIELGSSPAGAYFQRGELYLYQLREYEKALADFNNALQLNPGNSYWYKRRALTHFYLENYDQALADIAQAVKLNPDDSYNLTSISPSLVAKCPDKAFRDGILKLADRTIKLTNGSADAYARRGSLYAGLGQHEKAAADFSKAIELKASKLNPKNSSELNSLAWLLATCPYPQFREPKRAVELAEKAVKLAPEKGYIWNTLGVAHYRAGDFEAAIDALQESDELSNAAFSFSYNGFFLAMAHWQLGHKDEARRWHEQALDWMQKNMPDNEDLRRFRAEAAELLDLPAVAPKPEETNSPDRGGSQ